MALLIKSDEVTFSGSAALARMVEVLRQISAELGRDLTITAGSNGSHSQGSRHYVGEALDVRTKDQTPAQISDLAAALKKKLGPKFTVLHEDPGGSNAHIHLQPLKGSTYTWLDFVQVK